MALSRGPSSLFLIRIIDTSRIEKQILSCDSKLQTVISGEDLIKIQFDLHAVGQLVEKNDMLLNEVNLNSYSLKQRMRPNNRILYLPGTDYTI